MCQSIWSFTSPLGNPLPGIPPGIWTFAYWFVQIPPPAPPPLPPQQRLCSNALPKFVVKGKFSNDDFLHLN